MIGVVDYHGGNAPSVKNALEKLNLPSQFITSPQELAMCRLVVLPGVGSAAATLHSLEHRKLLTPLKHYIAVDKRPFLGICVGYQVLFEHSAEENTPCWGFVKGTVKAFPPQHVRVPQMGWNSLTLQPPRHPFFKNLPTTPYVYFVNSYYGNPQVPNIVIARARYHEEFGAMLHQENIVATQFHLEKSGPSGLTMLNNIITYYLTSFTA